MAGQPPDYFDKWCKEKPFTAWVLPNMKKCIWLENFINDWITAKAAPGSKWYKNIGHTSLPIYGDINTRVVLYTFFDPSSRVSDKEVYELKLELRNAVKDFYDFMGDDSVA